VLLITLLACSLTSAGGALMQTGVVPAPRFVANFGVVAVAGEKRILLHGCEPHNDYGCLQAAQPAELRTVYFVALIFPRNMQPLGRRYFIMRFPLRQ
jgi:hypothetical protein